MVWIKLKGVTGVESPSPRSFWCGKRRSTSEPRSNVTTLLQQSHICKGLFCERALLQKGYFLAKVSFAKEFLHLQRLGRIHHDNAPVVLLADPKIPAWAYIHGNEVMCMCTWICVCVLGYVYVYLDMCMCIWICVCILGYVCVYLDMCMCTWTCIWMHSCAWVCTDVYLVCLCVWVCTLEYVFMYI